MKFLTLLFFYIWFSTSVCYSQNKNSKYYKNPFPQGLSEKHLSKKQKQYDLPEPKIRPGIAKVDIYFDGFIDESKKFNLLYANPITGEDISLDIVLDSTGHGTGLIPIVSECEVLFSGIGKSWLGVFLAPGKNISIYIRSDGNNKDEVYFDGQFAEINQQYHQYDLENFARKSFPMGDFYALLSKPGISSENIQNFILSNLKIGFEKLDQISDLNLSTQQLVKINLRMYAVDLILSARGMLNQERRNNPKIQEASFGSDFYSVLKDLNFNDQYSLYSFKTAHSINFAIFLFQELSHVYVKHNYLSVSDIADLKRDNEMSDLEIEYLNLLVERHPDNWSDKTKASLDTLALKITEWLGKQEILPVKVVTLMNEIKSSENGNRSYQFLFDQMASIPYLIGNEIKDKPNFAIQPFAESHFDTNTDFIRNFKERFAEDMRSFFNDRDADENDAMLKKLLKEDKGIVFDLTRSQLFSRKIVKQSTLLNKYDFRALKKIEDKHILAYLSKINSDLQQKSVLNKKEFKLYQISKNVTNPDDILKEIRGLFVGKAVFFDFWATWCGPCLQAIEQLEKENLVLDNKKVEYIYLTDQSSPTKTWNNMVEKIGGTHIKLTIEQFSSLKNKFGFTGIPAYLLIDKNGDVKYSHTGFEGVDKIKNLISIEHLN